ncbi:MAG: dihydroorotase [Bacteroidales bacterium]|nr:dihydroorotase [Bacteroidales bacterium]
MKATLLHKATIVTSQQEGVGSILIVDDKIDQVIYSDDVKFEYLIYNIKKNYPELEIIDLDGKWIMAGGIDAHVHFREPGLTHKADMETESMAAAAGGVTSVIDMPNTSPVTTSAEALAGKLELTKDRVAVNIGFNIGATNGNYQEICEMLEGKSNVNPENIGGVKVFMGSSTGNMLVDSGDALTNFFDIKERPVLVHCEDERTIKANMEKAKEKYGEEVPFTEHENIRSRFACIKSSIKALELAINKGTKLVLCHISTKEELEMVRAAKLNNPDIIAETSCTYLWFCNEDYSRLGSKVKCNPSVKTANDREALIKGLAEGVIDTIGSDHAPHLLSEKDANYFKAPSGLPTIQQSLSALLTIAVRNEIPLTQIAKVFSEKTAELYGLKRGKIEKGYAADLVIFDLNKEFTVKAEDIYSKCGWSPYEGETLKGYIEMVLVNGETALKDGKMTTAKAGQLLKFN